MKCPVDNSTLSISDRQGIEIDYCPECRGVWLDRGELDKLIERSRPDTSSSPSRDDYRRENAHGDQRYESDSYDQRKYGKKRKRESFIGDLFDF